MPTKKQHRGGKDQFATVLKAETRALFDRLHRAREEEIEADLSIAAYLEYLINKEARAQGIGGSSVVKRGRV